MIRSINVVTYKAIVLSEDDIVLESIISTENIRDLLGSLKHIFYQNRVKSGHISGNPTLHIKVIDGSGYINLRDPYYDKHMSLKQFLRGYKL